MGQMGPTLRGCIILTGYCKHFIERCANAKGVTKITQPKTIHGIIFWKIPIAVLLTITYDPWDDPPKTYCSPPVSAAPLEGFPKSLSLVFLEVAVEVAVSPGIDGPLLGTHISAR